MFNFNTRDLLIFILLLSKSLTSRSKERRDVIMETVVTESLQYPHQDKETLKIIKEKWENYYNCLENKVNEFKSPKIELIMVLEGKYAKLKCNVCARPFEEYSEVRWMYKTLTPTRNDTTLQELYIPSNMMLTQTQSLKIYNVVKDQSGLYVCYRRKQIISAYIVEVEDKEMPVQITTKKFRKERNEIMDLRVYTKWSYWSPCSNCGVTGERYRYGICMVTVNSGNLESEDIRSKRLNQEETSQNKSLLTRNRKSHKHSQKMSMEFRSKMMSPHKILSSFKYGIPCTSKYLPNNIKSIEEIRNRRNIIEVSLCKIKCQRNVIFKVKDKNNATIETANNSAGFYVFIQGVPKLVPDVERRIIYPVVGENVTIKCLGNLRSNYQIKWMFNGLHINRHLIERQTRGRLKINELNQIEITRIMLTDSGIFSCWQNQILSGTTHIVVRKKQQFHAKNEIFIISLLVILLPFAAIIFKIFGQGKHI